MISIRCSILETIRQNPSAYGQLLATDNGKTGGGNHGMFAYFQDVARLVHLNEITTAEGVRELQSKFLRFNDTKQNKDKQERLIDQFVKYCRLFEKEKFEFVDGWRQMRWNFLSEVKLTGRTPWVVANDEGYYSYILAEKDFEWKTELRFPLFQQYLVGNTVDCNANEIKVGIYSLSANRFEFKNYSLTELAAANDETKSICQKVYSEYKKRKK